MLKNLQGVGVLKTSEATIPQRSSMALQIPDERCSWFPTWEHVTPSIFCVEFKNHMAFVYLD